MQEHNLRMYQEAIQANLVLQSIAKMFRAVLAEYGETDAGLILFGSRVTGLVQPDSDWDFLVVTEKDYSFPDASRIKSRIRRDIAKRGISVDIILHSRKSLSACARIRVPSCITVFAKVCPYE